jgi:hypothetical protein
MSDAEYQNPDINHMKMSNLIKEVHKLEIIAVYYYYYYYYYINFIFFISCFIVVSSYSF